MYVLAEVSVFAHHDPLCQINLRINELQVDYIHCSRGACVGLIEFMGMDNIFPGT